MKDNENLSQEELQTESFLDNKRRSRRWRRQQKINIKAHRANIRTQIIAKRDPYKDSSIHKTDKTIQELRVEELEKSYIDSL